MMNLIKRILYIFLLVNCFFSFAYADNFKIIEENAKGKKVYLHAWGGSPQVNNYLVWVKDKIKKNHDIDLIHIKLNDTSDAIDQILAEKMSGNIDNGSVDLVWVNGENFSFMKNNNLLQTKSWVKSLPSFRFTDADKMPGILVDFGIKTDGLEAPWGKSQLVFGYNENVVKQYPVNSKELLIWIKENPNRFTYPKPPDFTGTTFLKQILLENSLDTSLFYLPPDMNNYKKLLNPLWEWLDVAHPFLWREGKNFPINHSKLTQLLGDKEIFISFSLNPGEFVNGISNGVLPKSIKTYIHENGTISNFHFVAIPFNSNSTNAAKVVANFLMSPEAQLKKSDPNVWGDLMVISTNKLNNKSSINNTLNFNKSLQEPHPDWVPLLEKEWKKRYQN